MNNKVDFSQIISSAVNVIYYITIVPFMWIIDTYWTSQRTEAPWFKSRVTPLSVMAQKQWLLFNRS